MFPQDLLSLSRSPFLLQGSPSFLNACECATSLQGPRPSIAHFLFVLTPAGWQTPHPLPANLPTISRFTDFYPLSRMHRAWHSHLFLRRLRATKPLEATLALTQLLPDTAAISVLPTLCDGTCTKPQLWEPIHVVPFPVLCDQNVHLWSFRNHYRRLLMKLSLYLGREARVWEYSLSVLICPWAEVSVPEFTVRPGVSYCTSLNHAGIL